MIRRLRKRHAVFAVGLLVGGPAVLALAWAVRPGGDAFVMDRLPGPAPAPTTTPAGATARSATDFPLRVTVARDSARGVMTITATAYGPLRVPDPLLYLGAVERPAGAALPPGSVLLGPVGEGRVLQRHLWFDSVPNAASLILWSNGHSRVVQTVGPPR